MAQGEVKWSSAGKTVERFTRTLLPKGEYDLKFSEKDIQQKKGTKPGQVPYINVMFEALGTAQSENGKNAKLFHKFFLHLLVSPKDGKVMVDRQGGLVDLALALGETLSFRQIQVPYQKYDAKGNREGEMVRINILDPAEVLAWLKAKDGAVVRALVKQGKKQEAYDQQNEIDYFIPAEESGTEEEFAGLDEETPPEDAEETPPEEDELADLEETPEEEAAEEEPEEDMTAAFNPKAKAAAAKAPAKPAAKAPPSKVKQGPAGKRK